MGSRKRGVFRVVRSVFLFVYLDGGNAGDRLINANSFSVHKCTVPGCGKVCDSDRPILLVPLHTYMHT